MAVDSAAPAATAEQSATSRTELDAIAAQAGASTPFVRDVLAAKPVGILLAGGALLRRALRGRRGRRHHQREAKQAAGHRKRTPIIRQ